MMNSHIQHACIAVVVGLVCTLACAAPSTAASDPETLGDRLDNAVLNGAVRIALLQELKVDALDLDIDADDDRGLVTVRGQVADRASLELAEEIVRSVDGVEKVRTDLTLEGFEEGKTRTGEELQRELSDSLLEARVSAALMSEIGTNIFDLEIETADGVVTLRGQVQSDRIRDTALTKVRELDGVKRVIDLIDVD